MHEELIKAAPAVDLPLENPTGFASYLGVPSLYLATFRDDIMRSPKPLSADTGERHERQGGLTK